MGGGWGRRRNVLKDSFSFCFEGRTEDVEKPAIPLKVAIDRAAG